MKTIATALCLLAFLSITVLSEPTLVSYIVDVQEQKRQDYLQVTFSTNAEHEGLEAAVDQAQKEAQNLKQQAEQICNRLTKKSKECKKAVQIGNVKIEPSYKEVKKDKVYEKITASFEVTITWKDIKNFGAYIDQLLKVEGIIIEKIQWKADQDLLKNKFLKQSLQKGEALCAELGKKFKQVVNMQQLREKPKKPEPKPEPQEGEEQQQEEEQPKEEQQEEQQESISYKITLSCDGKAELKKKKK